MLRPPLEPMPLKGAVEANHPIQRLELRAGCKLALLRNDATVALAIEVGRGKAGRVWVNVVTPRRAIADALIRVRS